MMEVWKAIEGYEGLYEVSSYGRVKSLDRTIIYSNNKTVIKKGIMLKQSINQNGYLRVGLLLNHYQKWFSVHRLVGIAFIPNPDNKPQINHIDSNRQNNHIFNLEWCTRSENSIHAYKFGLKSSTGEDNGNSSLTNDDVFKIKQLLSEGKFLQREIAEMYGVSIQTINKIKFGKLWSHI